MTRKLGLGSKPDQCRLGKLSDRAYIPFMILVISVLIVGLNYLFGG